MVIVCKGLKDVNKEGEELFSVIHKGITRNNKMQLRKGKCRLNTSKSFLARTSVRLGNNLPREMVEASLSKPF